MSAAAISFRSFADLHVFAARAYTYRELRRRHPWAGALHIWRFVTSDEYQTFEQYHCATAVGHTWAYTGTAYGGDDESYLGEGHCYCANCGADGDA